MGHVVGYLVVTYRPTDKGVAFVKHILLHDFVKVTYVRN